MEPSALPKVFTLEENYFEKIRIANKELIDKKLERYGISDDCSDCKTEDNSPISDQAFLLNLAYFEPIPKRNINENIKARLRILLKQNSNKDALFE